MADIGLNPPLASNVHSTSGIVQDTNCQFGAVVKSSGDGNYADVQTTTTAGDVDVVGVIQSQGDPNNGGKFAVGDSVTVRDMGDAQVLVAPGTILVVGDVLVTSTVAGVAKKLGAEAAPYDIIGYSRQAITTGANAQLVSVRLNITRKL